MGPPGVSCRAVLAGATAQRASVLIAGPLGLCYLPTFLCLGIVPVVAGLAGDVLGPGRMWGRIARQLSRGPAADPERDSWEGKAMVGNMIRILRARMTLLAVDEAGMSTVEYSTAHVYTFLLVSVCCFCSQNACANLYET